MPSEKLIYIGQLNKDVISILGVSASDVKIYRSKGLLTHLMKRKHYKAAKYVDYISDIIENQIMLG